MQDKKSKVKHNLPFGVCVWSTGLATNPVVAGLQAALGQPRRRALAVDKCLKVRGAEGVYSVGDCADVKSGGTELLDHAAELFKQADADRNGSVDSAEFSRLLTELETSYPQVRALRVLQAGGGGEGGKLNDLIDKFDGDKNGTLCLKEFTRALAEADARLSSHPATAQVANQQGEYLAKQLNAAARAGLHQAPEQAPFMYKHLAGRCRLALSNPR